MKITYVSNNNWPGTEPGLTFSVFNARGFRQAGADCLLILFGQTSKPVQEVYKELFGFDEELPILPIRAPRIGGSKFLFYLRTFLYLLNNNTEILITRNLNFLFWAVLLKKLRGVRIYFESHDFWTDLSLRQESISAGHRRQGRLERKWLPRVDGIICQSEPQSLLYRNYYPGMPVLTALPGTKPSVVKDRKGFSYTLGYIGSFTKDKYPLTVVLKALAAIKDPRIRLICIGAKNEIEKDRVHREANSLKISDRVEIYSWVTGSMLEQLKARIDVGVAVLASDMFWNRLSTPLKILEYLSTATPFIATRLDGISSLISHGKQGLLINNTPEQWEIAIRTIYSDFSYYQQMAKECAILCAELRWEHRAGKIIEALESGIFAQNNTCPDHTGKGL